MIIILCSKYRKPTKSAITSFVFCLNLLVYTFIYYLSIPGQCKEISYSLNETKTSLP